MPLKIGITGGIGSGKTLVSKYFEKHGYSVFYADSIAKQLLLEDNKVRSEIIVAFGEKSYVAGLPNKEYLAEIIFNNPEKLSVINSIIHPPTINRIKKLCELELLNKNLVFTEAALIFEANMQDIFDYVLVVTAEEKLRIKRIVEREKTNEAEVKNRIANQLPEEVKISRADFVIHNNSSLQELENKADLFLTIFKNLAK